MIPRINDFGFLSLYILCAQNCPRFCVVSLPEFYFSSAQITSFSCCSICTVLFLTMSFFILWGSGGSMEATYGVLHWKLYFCSQMVAYQGNYRVGWVRGRQPVNPMTSRSHGSRKPQMTLAREKGEGCVKLMVRTILDHVLIANNCCLSPSFPYHL